MSPQPKKTDQDAPDAGAPDVTPDATPDANGALSRVEQIAAGLIEPESGAERQIARAGALERQMAELQEKVGKNRDYLRLMDANEELTSEEGDWLDAFYPVKTKGEQRTANEITRTRKVKESARKGAAAVA